LTPKGQGRDLTPTWRKQVEARPCGVRTRAKGGRDPKKMPPGNSVRQGQSVAAGLSVVAVFALLASDTAISTTYPFYCYAQTGLPREDPPAVEL
jgi:hypothetical protein